MIMKIDNLSGMLNKVAAKGVIKIGQRVEVNIDTLAHKNDEVVNYASRIEDIRDNGTICLALPVDEKLRPIIPLTGSPINARIIAPNCVYNFRTVYHRIENIPLPAWIVDAPETLVRTQEREFVRVALKMPIEVTIENSDGSMQRPIHLQSSDVSGGGLGFFSNDMIAEGKRVIIKTNVIPSVGRISTFAEVKRCQYVEKQGKYLIGVQFVDFSPQIQNKLVKYLFTQQRIMINKGVIIK